MLEEKKLKTKKLHELRKLLKTFYYNEKMLGLGRKNKLSKKNSDHLQELLGKWHDKHVMNGHLKKAVKQNKLKHAEIEKINKVRKKNLYERKALQKK